MKTSSTSATNHSLSNDLTAPFHPYSQPQLLSYLMSSYMQDPLSLPVLPKPLPLKPISPQDQQKSYVNALVDVTVQAIASIWPHANAHASAQRPIASLNTFLHHILKHSRTTHSTLQLAIFYLFRIRPKVQTRDQKDVYIACGRRMFLAALICAHKFLQDKTYKNSAWSKVSGLHVSEINHAEKLMLQLLDYHLHVKKETYDQWVSMLQTHIQTPVPRISPPPSPTYGHLPHHSLSTPASTPPHLVHSSSPDSASSSCSTPLNAPMAALHAKFLPAALTSVALGMPTPVEAHNTSPPYSRKRKASLDHPSKKPRY